MDVPCHGALRLYAVPIWANDNVVGAINFGYGSPPSETNQLILLSQKYKVPIESLKSAQRSHPILSTDRIDEAKRRLLNAARLIGLIVERHRAQLEAREASKRHRLLFETMGQGVIYFNDRGRVVEVNPAACRILGRTFDEFVKESEDGAVEAIDEQGRRLSFEDLPLVRAMKEGQRISGDIIGLHNPIDGQIHWIQGEVVPLINPDTNQPYQYYTVVSDVTKQKQAAKALQESEERLRLSMQAANQGFYDLNLSTGDAVVSPEYALMLGYDPTDFQETNQKWLDRLHPDDRQQVESEFRRYVSGDIQEYSIEFRQRTMQGKWKWIWSLGKIVEREPDGTPLRMMGTHTDIDARKASEEQMRHVQKLESLGVLAGGIAHDFNNLLMTMMGNADLALDSMHDVHPSRSFVSDIKVAAQSAAELCRQMLAYAGKGRFVLEKIDLSAMVHEMGHILRVSVSKNASLRYDLAEELPLIEADAPQIRQIIMNLITNASDAVDDVRGIISVSTGQMMCDRQYLSTLVFGTDLSQGHYVFIEVSDTGIGMDVETQKRIFDPFFTTKFIGRGLGLAALLGIVQGHRGGIKLYSEYGRGTTFKVLFPATEGGQAAIDSSAEQDTLWTGSGTILLVDDEPQVRSVGSQMLRRLGFQVIEAADGMHAIDKIQQHPDEILCVLLDLTMPRMNGEEAFREIRRINKDIRVVLSSGYNEQEVTQRLAGKGLAGFIQKPFTLSGLRKTLHDILD